MTAPPPPDAAYRKLRLIAESSRARKRLAQALSPAVSLDASAQRLAEGAARLIRQPAVVGALALVIALAGPGRVFRTVRWLAFTLPFHPVGRRLLPAIGNRLTAWLSSRRPR